VPLCPFPNAISVFPMKPFNHIFSKCDAPRTQQSSEPTHPACASIAVATWPTSPPAHTEPVRPRLDQKIASTSTTPPPGLPRRRYAPALFWHKLVPVADVAQLQRNIPGATRCAPGAPTRTSPCARRPSPSPAPAHASTSTRNFCTGAIPLLRRSAADRASSAAGCRRRASGALGSRSRCRGPRGRVPRAGSPARRLRVAGGAAGRVDRVGELHGSAVRAHGCTM